MKVLKKPRYSANQPGIEYYSGWENGWKPVQIILPRVGGRYKVRIGKRVKLVPEDLLGETHEAYMLRKYGLVWSK